MTRDFLADNLKTIAEKRPELFHTLKAFFAGGGASSFRITSTAGGETSVELKAENGRWDDWYGRSPSSAELESAGMSVFAYPRILIFDGVGLGHHILAMHDKIPESVRDVLIVEKRPELFAAALKSADWRAYLRDEKFEFLVGLAMGDLSAFARSWLCRRERIIYTEHIEHYYLKPAMDKDGAYYAAVAKSLRDGVNDLREMFTAPGEDNYRALINIVRNAERIVACPLIDDFAGIFTGKPGLLISAGPALNSQLADIARFGERFVMVAVDAALKPLLAHGIRPHLVVSAERLVNVVRFFDGSITPAISRREMGEDTPNIPLVTFPSLHPAVWPLAPGPVILMKRSATFGTWLYPDLPEPDTGLGVATVAYHVLAVLGCRSIAIVGQNLSFDDASASTHAEGVSDFMAMATRELSECFVTGNDNRPVRATPVWQYFRDEMERLIHARKIKTVNVMPCDKGAMIAGTSRIDPPAFWQDAERLAVGDYSSSLADKLGSVGSPLHGVDFAELKAQALRYLKEVHARCYADMEWISTDYHDRVDLLSGRELWGGYREVVGVWEERRRGIVEIDALKFYRFLNCLTAKSHIVILSAREAAVPKPEAMRQYVFTYMLKTLEWFHEVGSWAQRVIHLLEG